MSVNINKLQSIVVLGNANSLYSSTFSQISVLVISGVVVNKLLFNERYSMLRSYPIHRFITIIYNNETTNRIMDFSTKRAGRTFLGCNSNIMVLCHSIPMIIIKK